MHTSFKEEFLHFLKLDLTNLSRLDLYHPVRKLPKKLKNLYSYELKIKNENYKNNLIFLDSCEKNLYLADHRYADHRYSATIIRLLKRYGDYNLFEKYKIKNLSNTTFRLIDESATDLLELMTNLSLLKIKLEELGIVNFSFDLYTSEKIDFSCPLAAYDLAQYYYDDYRGTRKTEYNDSM